MNKNQFKKKLLLLIMKMKIVKKNTIQRINKKIIIKISFCDKYILYKFQKFFFYLLTLLEFFLTVFLTTFLSTSFSSIFDYSSPPGFLHKYI